MNPSKMLARCQGKQACVPHMRLGSLPGPCHIRHPRFIAVSALSHQSGVQGPSSSPVATEQEPTTAPSPPHRLAAHQQQESSPSSTHSTFLASFSLFLLANAPAACAQTFEPVNPFTGVYAPGQYVTFALFLMTVPGSTHAC